MDPGSDSSDEAAGTASDDTTDDRRATADERQPSVDDGTAASGEGWRGRDVVVPLRVYKTVTVFATLFAIVGVLAGFMALDLATDRARADLPEIDAALAIAGLALIFAGAAVYAFSVRFRAAGMGNAKDDADEPPNNG